MSHDNPFDDVDFNGIVHELDDGRALIADEGVGLGQIRNPRPPRGYQDPLQAEFDHLDNAARTSPVRDEFYHMAEAHLARVKDVNDEARYVGNPPSATRQPLGGRATLTSDLVIARAPVLRWEGTDAETGPVTITLGIQNPLVVNTLVVRPFVYIRWGAYGANFEAEVDIGRGRQLTVNASMIEVDVALEALTAANIAQVVMQGNLSFKPMVRTSPLIRTRYLDSMVQNTAVNVVVPPFAVGLLPVQMVDTAGVLTLDFYDTAGTLRYTLSVPNGSQTALIPLGGDIVRVTVTSTAATTQHVRLMFELAI